MPMESRVDKKIRDGQFESDMAAARGIHQALNDAVVAFVSPSKPFPAAGRELHFLWPGCQRRTSRRRRWQNKETLHG
jgi:hypothetical protein